MPKEPSKLQQQINWYLSLFILFLFITVPPVLCGLFYLSQVPEVMWERDDSLTYDRIWLYRERRPLGIAYQTQRIVKEYSQTELCVQSNLHFFLWGSSKEAEAAVSSRRVVWLDNRWQFTGQACD